MQLSEAIRLGAMLRPQAFGAWRQRQWLFGSQEATCALAAAYEASGLTGVRFPKGTHVIIGARGVREGRREVLKHDTVITVPAPYAWHMGMEVSCPSLFDRCDLRRSSLERIIEHLNDNHRWTRDQIADWVEQFELQQVPIDIPAAEVVEV